MLQAKLEKDHISQPELWRLAIMPGNESLDVALYPPVAREEMILRSFPLDLDAPTKLKALEDVIYENPLLLSDFRRIDWIVNNPSHIIIPADSPESCNEKFLKATFPSLTANSEILEFALTDKVKCLQSIDSDIMAFLKRTFFNIRITSRIQLLVKYFTTISSQLSPRRVIVFAHGKYLTFLAIDGSNLLAANDFRFENNADAAYYIMASLTNIGFLDSEIRFDFAFHGQNTSSQNSITEIIKNYIPNIKSVPFPTLRYRASKATILSPFPMLILPICES